MYFTLKMFRDMPFHINQYYYFCRANNISIIHNVSSDVLFTTRRDLYVISSIHYQFKPSYNYLTIDYNAITYYHITQMFHALFACY